MRITAGLLVIPGTWAVLHPCTIQGDRWTSPYLNQRVQNVQGVVTAVLPKHGFWIRGADQGCEPTAPRSIFVWESRYASLGVERWSKVRVDGEITDRCTGSDHTRQGSLPALEIKARNVNVLGTSSVEPRPIVLGRDRSPPTSGLWSALDEQPDPKGSQQALSEVNNRLEPRIYALDFWHSLRDEYVSIEHAVALKFNDPHPDGSPDGSIWVRLDVDHPGQNARGGLTSIRTASGREHFHPEAVAIRFPLNGKRNPVVSMGTKLKNIKGILRYNCGIFMIYPLDAPQVDSLPAPSIGISQASKPATVPQRDRCEDMAVASYNLQGGPENEASAAEQIEGFARQIIDDLQAPALLLLQEASFLASKNQKTSSSANLMETIKEQSGGKVDYVKAQLSYRQGNFDPVILYQHQRLRLVKPLLASINGLPEAELYGFGESTQLRRNPAHLTPDFSPGFNRPPIVALFETTKNNQRIWVINVHLRSSGHGGFRYNDQKEYKDLRPPLDETRVDRVAATKAVQAFVQEVQKRDPHAKFIVAGDFNDVPMAEEVFSPFAGLLYDVADQVGLPAAEQYTIMHIRHGQMLDRIFVSQGLIEGIESFRIHHFSTHARFWGARPSDHDPLDAKLLLCPQIRSAPQPGEASDSPPDTTTYAYPKGNWTKNSMLISRPWDNKQGATDVVSKELSTAKEAVKQPPIKLSQGKEEILPEEERRFTPAKGAWAYGKPIDSRKLNLAKKKGEEGWGDV